LCTSELEIVAPEPCSVPLCEISTTMLEIQCDDNGTPGDDTDDIFFIEVSVEGNGQSWIADDPANTTGNYNTEEILGPFGVSDGDFVISFTDADDPLCTSELEIVAPEPCSFCPDIDTSFITIPVCSVVEARLDTLNLATLEGCDSVVVEAYEFDPQEFIFRDSVICEGTNGIDEGDMLQDTIPGLMACDTILITSFKILAVEEDLVTFSICSGDSVEYNGQVYSDQNTSSIDTLLSENACDSVYLFVEIEVLDIAFNITAEDQVCAGEDDGAIIISPVESDAGLLTVILGNTVIDTVSNFPFYIESLPPGVYDVLLEDQDGCQFGQTIEILEAEDIELELIIVDQSSGSNQIVLEAISNIDDAMYSWTLFERDTVCMNCPIISSSPESSFTYSVMLESEQGCIEMDELAFMRSVADESLYIPNIFSPDGDGRNDEFEVINQAPQSTVLILSIYDRWGNLVHTDRSSERVNWDGRFGNTAIMPGVYVYKIEIEYMASSRVELRYGDVTIVR